MRLKKLEVKIAFYFKNTKKDSIITEEDKEELDKNLSIL